MKFHARDMLLLLSVLLLSAPSSVDPSSRLRIKKEINSLNNNPNWPAFCSRTRPLTSDIDRQQASSAIIQKWKVVHLKLSQGEAACVESALAPGDSNSNPNSTTAVNPTNVTNILHVFRYSDYKQAHPIVHEYTFGIPQLQTECSCHCPGSKSKCLAATKGAACENQLLDPSSGLCRRTYHTDGDPAGCASPTGFANVCCEVSATPYKGVKFSAVDINQPTAFGTLTYQIYYERDGRWIKMTSQDFQVSFGEPSTIQFDEGSIVDLRVTSQGSCNCLNRGMYYLESNAKNVSKISLYADSALNRMNEWSLSKLGWFRFNETQGQWHMDKTAANLQSMLDVKIQNCKDQEYEETFSQTGYYVTDHSSHRHAAASSAADAARTNPDVMFDSYVGKRIDEREVWISDISISTPNDRHIIVKHRSPPPLILDFELNASTSALNFVHHLSFFRDFDVEIRLDTFSNRYLRLVLINAQGSVSGMVYEGENSRTNGVPFDIPGVDAALSKDEFYVRLDESVTARRFVCLRPFAEGGGQRCKWAEYVEKPMENFDGASEKIIAKRGRPCPECNNEEEQGFFARLVKGLNPSNWLSGIAGLPESVALGVTIVFYLIIVILIIGVCRRFLCPVLGWAICSGGLRSSRASEKV